MVSSSHEAMHRLFQEDPGVFVRTFHRLGVPFADPAAVMLVSPDLTEIRPLERRADTLLRIDCVDGESFHLIVEAQSRKDQAKPRSWLYYLAYLEAKYGIPAALLVVCQDRGTASWAQGPFRYGPRAWPGVQFQPLVLGPHNMPVITEVSAAAEDIPLAALSAITHGRDPQAGAILKALAGALKVADEDTAGIFIDFTELGLVGSPALETWRHLMSVDLAFFRSPTSQRLREEGRGEGLAAGRAQDILRLLEQRGVPVPDAARARIGGCADLTVLDRWFDRILVVSRAEELFEESGVDEG